MEQTKSCPFGHKCQTFGESGVIDQCRSWIGIRNDDGETDYKCGILEWPIFLHLENLRISRTHAEITSVFRAEVMGEAQRPQLLT